MSPTSLRFVTRPFMLALAAFLATILLGIAAPAVRAQGAGVKKADKPLYVEYKGVRIGMSAEDVRKKLGDPKDKSDAQDFFMFSDSETAQVYYDKGKVMAVSVSYLGVKDAPVPKSVFGTDIEPKADGGIFKLIRYPDAGYFVSYSKTAGDDPLVTVTMQRIQ
ncbi:MAG: hypothetical protein DMF68_14275 [Acidobacteria bacterium]|nr:MAG: hypothetical protein DMF68_14275 [Acidobacteriota bacterium]